MFRTLRRQTKVNRVVLGLLLALLLVVIGRSTAFAANPSIISFQGKVVNANGTNVTDGSYSFSFVMFDDPTLGSESDGIHDKWHELSKTVTVTNGVFQTNLGSATALPDFNTNSSLYLAVKFNADSAGYMTPRIQMASVPYALNADKVGGVSASSLVQLGATQSGNINIGSGTLTSGLINGQTISTSANFTGTLTVQGASALTLGTASSHTGAVLFKSAGGTNIITLQGPGSNPTSSYALTLPTGAPALGQCLQNDGTTIGQLTFGSCYANSLQAAYNGGSTITQTAAGTINFTTGSTVPTADQLVIDNTGSSGVTTAGINSLNVKYKGGAAAVEGSGLRVDYTPGTTSGGTWSGVRIVAGATGPVTGVTAYGIKLEGPTSQGAGNEEGVYVGSGWDIGIDVQSGGLQLAAQAEPATPTAGNLRIYAKDIAGRVMPKWIGPAGVDTPFQASLGFNRVEWAAPNNGTNCSTSLSQFGTTVTGSASACAHPVLASTNLLTSIRRMTYATAGTNGALAYQRQPALQVWRGNAAGVGGFFYTIRFATSTTPANMRAFVGLSDTIANPTNIDPTTSNTYGKLGMAIDLGSGNWNFVNNITGTAPTVAALGANYPVSTTNVYELVMFSAPNGSSIGYRITNITTGNTTSGSVSTNIPSSTTFMAPVFWITNGTTLSAATIDWAGWYLESDN